MTGSDHAILVWDVLSGRLVDILEAHVSRPETNVTYINKHAYHGLSSNTPFAMSHGIPMSKNSCLPR